MGTDNRAPQVAGRVVGDHRHIRAFSNSTDEQHFIKDGLLVEIRERQPAGTSHGPQ